jgi:hypothetical protein
LFSAKNFINKNFKSSENNKNYTTQLKAIDILKQIKNVEGDNILYKTGISIKDAYNYLQDFESEIFVHEKIKNFDFTPVYSKWPTQLDKIKGEELKATKVDISAIKQEIIVRPSDLNFEFDLSEQTVNDFLLKKVKRQRPVKDFENLPQNIQNLIKTFGDVCANITNKTFENYLFYRRFIEFERRSDRMDEY